jgi:hypothetical protein
MKRREKDQELADRAYLLRAWRRHHREQLQEALAGVHRDVLEHLMEELKDLRSARELVNFIAAQNWELVDADARAVALHEINAAICRLREKLGQPPIDRRAAGRTRDRVPNHSRDTHEFPAAGGKVGRTEFGK